jgi:hypothetical protein
MCDDTMWKRRPSIFLIGLVHRWVGLGRSALVPGDAVVQITTVPVMSIRQENPGSVDRASPTTRL